jgi:hypothetical protein
MKALMILITLLLTTGCVKKTVTFENQKELASYSFTFIDNHKTDEPSSFTESRNIWSCMYGIDAIEDNDVLPSKAIVVKNYLASNLREELKGKKIALERFDIYWNNQKSLRETSVPVIVPGVGTVLVSQTGEGSVYGCKNKMRGEFAASEMPKEIRNQRVATFVAYLEVVVGSSSFEVRMTSLDNNVITTGKEGDEYADILKRTILETLHALAVKIKAETHLNQ